MAVKVRKTNGELEIYSESKIRASAQRVGVPKSLLPDMLAEIRSKLYDTIPTSEIFAIIKNYLSRSDSPYLAIKYNLKAALSELGPSGYPFEQYVARLLTAQGYKTTTNRILRGKCVSHEVDVLAVKEGTTYFVEAKFHRRIEERSDVKVALYIRARYEDISSRFVGPTTPWIVTNTRFSSDALAYANCRDIKITSWGYPKGEGIMDMIEETALYPLTMLESLTLEDKKLLLSHNLVVCRDLLGEDKISLLPVERRQVILAQVRAICSTNSG